MSATPTPKLIAFHLPQFHPIPENDGWWGKGFTEWTNVAKARPLFRGHYQPHLPADLGFYDLRLPEAREAQAALARSYGVHGFCYYHYWFNGRRVLERPVNDILSSGMPDFPFCLCWANENWTRTWDGQHRQVLLKQNYSTEDDRNHIHSLLPVLSDPRYIRVDGKPLFLIYRASDLPHPAATIEIWQDEARRAGLNGLYLCRVERAAQDHGDPRPLGFDAGVQFEPDPIGIDTRMAPPRLWYLTRPNAALQVLRKRCTLYYYPEMARRGAIGRSVGYPYFPCVFPNWDNSPRRSQGATIFINSTPNAYQSWLSSAIRRELGTPFTEKLVFINAWNEWAEGCHLEPDQLNGHDYLRATLAAVQETKQ